MMALTTQMESKSLAKMTKYKMLTANWNHSSDHDTKFADSGQQVAGGGVATQSPTLELV